MSRKTIFGRCVAIISALLITGFIAWGIYYLFLPAMTIHSGGFWIFCIITVGLCSGLFFAANAIVNYVQNEEKGYISGYIFGGAAILGLVVLTIVALAGSEMTNATKYSNVSIVEDGDFKVDIEKINTEDIVIIDVKTAQKTGDRTIGTIKNAAWFEVDDEYNLVIINGEKYRISPLNYGSVFKYFKGKNSGLPGYVLVNARTKDADAKYVKLDEAMRYSPSACFKYDLKRHLRSLYPNYVFGKSFFEVDDAGHPYWITGVKTSQVGLLGAKTTTSVVVVNAVTGVSEEYTLSDIPEWIDHVESVEELMKLADWHYSYWDGFWNAITSKTGVYKTSYYYKDQEQMASQEESKSDLAANKFTPFEGYNSIIKDGKVMFYTGLTPANNAESNIGFLLIDPRSKQFYFYEASGAEEASAQGAVEGLVSDLRYSASFPTIVNVEGIETYFMVLKDGAGLIQRFAFANVENYAKCVQAETIDKALEAYKIKIGLTSAQNSQEETKKELNLTGKVLEVKEAQIGGYTYYYFKIDGADAFVFMSSIENSNEQPMKLKTGNKISVKYYESEKEKGICMVTSISFE